MFFQQDFIFCLIYDFLSEIDFKSILHHKGPIFPTDFDMEKDLSTVILYNFVVYVHIRTTLVLVLVFIEQWHYILSI